MKILQSVSGWIDFASGVGAMASAGDIGRANKKLLETKANYNKKQIQEALIKNYANTISQYANARSNILLQQLAGDSNIRTQATQNIGSIDIDGSSFRGTAIGKLDQEFIAGINELEDNREQNLLALTANTINQERDIDLAVAQGKLEVDKQTAQMKREGLESAINGAMAMANIYQSNKQEDDDNTDIQNNIKNFKEKLTNPDETNPSGITNMWGRFIKPYGNKFNVGGN